MNVKDYIERLIIAGISEDDAALIVDDYLKDLDFDGLYFYCKGVERNNVETIFKQSVR